MVLDFTLTSGGKSRTTQSTAPRTAPRVAPRTTPKSTQNYKSQTTVSVNSALEGFVEVQRHEWKNIPIGTLVRYERSDGKFIPGGYLSKIWHNTEDNIDYITVDHEVVVGSNNAHSISLNRINKLYSNSSKVRPQSDSVNASIQSQSQSQFQSQVETPNISDKFQIVLNYIRKLEFRINTLESKLNESNNKLRELESSTANIQFNACKLSDVVSNINSSICNKKL